MKTSLAARMLAIILLATAVLCAAPSAAAALDTPAGSTFVEDGVTYEVLVPAVELLPESTRTVRSR